MKKLILKPFQIKAVEDLKKEVLHEWQKEGQREILFAAPTGSGKTLMMAQFVRELFGSPDLQDADFAFLWASIGGSKEGDLADQSKTKFNAYYGGAGMVSVSDLNSLSRDKVLKRGEMLFFNWSKIKTRNKDGRRLRRQNEQEITWDGMLQRTHSDNRRIILIIDEAHRESQSPLAEEEIKLIEPSLVIRVTATHRERKENIDVSVKHSDVVESGLIKQAIQSQTREDFTKRRKRDLDLHILDLAHKQREKLAKIYKNKCIDVNPLLMIQLPNDDRENQAEEKKRDIVERQLRNEFKVDKNKIAVWLDKEKKNLENITENNNEVEFLLFKQAPATGWDCPRAQVLLMYREAKDPVFQIQVLGRVLRMPEGKHYTDSRLNYSYLYTNYNKTEIMEQYDQQGTFNAPRIYKASVRKEIEKIKLETYESTRTRYNDLGKDFQVTFIKVAKRMLRNKKGKVQEDLFVQDGDRAGGINLNVVLDVIAHDYDGFATSMKEAQSMGIAPSHNDIEKMYRKLCVDILRKQEGETKFCNIARSYGKLKSAINVWFEDVMGIKDKKKYYKMVVGDLSRGANSTLLPVINQALKEYAPIREKQEQEKDARKYTIHDTEIPFSPDSYPGVYAKIKSTKCAMIPCYIETRSGKENINERNFIDYLEGNDTVEWWYKNGDHGADYFSVKKDVGGLFFPDWFIKTKDGQIWIVDTKGGYTAEGEDAQSKARALEEWLQKHKEYKGGLVKQTAGVWEIASDTRLKKWARLEL